MTLWAFLEQAIKIEIDSINNNNTWTLIDLPKGIRPIGCKWIFKRKYNHDGSINNYKARLIAKGFSQKSDIDYYRNLPFDRRARRKEKVRILMKKTCEVATNVY